MRTLRRLWIRQRISGSYGCSSNSAALFSKWLLIWVDSGNALMPGTFEKTPPLITDKPQQNFFCKIILPRPLLLAPPGLVSKVHRNSGKVMLCTNSLGSPSLRGGKGCQLMVPTGLFTQGDTLGFYRLLALGFPKSLSNFQGCKF